MPELPEVEIVRQSLNKKIKQKKVKKVIIRNRNLRFKIPSNFNNYFQNKKIIKVDRFSKYLIIYLSQGSYCLIHLGMTGTIHVVNNKIINKPTNTSFYNSFFLPKKHNHIELIFDNFKIVYNDPRRFGFFQLIKNSKQITVFLPRENAAKVIDEHDEVIVEGMGGHQGKSKGDIPNIRWQVVKVNGQSLNQLTRGKIEKTIGRR